MLKIIMHVMYTEREEIYRKLYNKIRRKKSRKSGK